MTTAKRSPDAGLRQATRAAWLKHRNIAGPASTLLTIATVEASLSGADANKAQAMDAAKSFNDVLVTHLDREEELVIPVLLQMTPDEAWAVFHGGHG